MDVRKELAQLVDDLLGKDPRIALIAYRRLVDDYLPWLEVRAVQTARNDQWNWAKIGRLLGRTRQSVRERFTRLEHSPPPRVKRDSAASMREERELARLRADQRRRQAFEALATDDVVAW